MMNLSTMQALVHGKPSLLYLALSLSAIGALIAQEDGGGIEQLVHYISCALRPIIPKQKGYAWQSSMRRKDYAITYWLMRYI